MAALDTAVIASYLAKWRNNGYTVTEISGTGTTATAVGAAVDAKRIFVIGFVLDCDTNGITVAFLSAGTTLWTLRFPVAASVVVKDLNLQCVTNEVFGIKKDDAVSALTGYIVWKALKDGEHIPGW